MCRPTPHVRKQQTFLAFSGPVWGDASNQTCPNYLWRVGHTLLENNSYCMHLFFFRVSCSMWSWIRRHWAEHDESMCSTDTSAKISLHAASVTTRLSCTLTFFRRPILLSYMKGIPLKPRSTRLQSSRTSWNVIICHSARLVKEKCSSYLRASLKSPITIHERSNFPWGFLGDPTLNVYFQLLAHHRHTLIST